MPSRSRYSPRGKTLKVKGKKIKIRNNESRSQYWERVKRLGGRENW